MKKIYILIPIICSLYLAYPLIHAKISEISISERIYLSHIPSDTTTNTKQYSLPVFNIGNVISYEYRTIGNTFSVSFYCDGHLYDDGADQGGGTIVIPEYKTLITLTFINTDDYSNNGWIYVEIEKATDLTYIYNPYYFLGLIGIVVLLIIVEKISQKREKEKIKSLL